MIRYSWVQEPVPLMSAAMNPEKSNSKLILLKAFLTAQESELSTTSIFFILATHSISFTLLTCSYASPLALYTFSESLDTQTQVAEPDV